MTVKEQYLQKFRERFVWSTKNGGAYEKGTDYSVRVLYSFEQFLSKALDAQRENDIAELKKFVEDCNPDSGQSELRSCYNEWSGELLESLDQLKGKAQ